MPPLNEEASYDRFAPFAQSAGISPALLGFRWLEPLLSTHPETASSHQLRVRFRKVTDVYGNVSLVTLVAAVGPDNWNP